MSLVPSGRNHLTEIKREFRHGRQPGGYRTHHAVLPWTFQPLCVWSLQYVRPGNATRGISWRYTRQRCLLHIGHMILTSCAAPQWPNAALTDALDGNQSSMQASRATNAISSSSMSQNSWSRFSASSAWSLECASISSSIVSNS